jgi:hypothetical protein
MDAIGEEFDSISRAMARRLTAIEVLCPRMDQRLSVLTSALTNERCPAGSSPWLLAA